LLKRLNQTNVFVVALKIEVVSPDERIYGFKPWYPIKIVKKEGE